MITENFNQQLHDRATRGEPLSGEERGRRDVWYASQDQEESANLGPVADPSSITAIRAKIDAAVAQSRAVAQQIQRLTIENASICYEIESIRRRCGSGTKGIGP